MNRRENLFRILKKQDNPEFPRITDTLIWQMPLDASFDPVAGYDWFGVHWTSLNQPGPTVSMGQPMLNNLENWERRIHFPNLDDYNEIFEADAAKFKKTWDKENQLGMVDDPSCHFERLISIVGFENGCMAFYETPDELMDFFNALTEFKIELFKRIKKYYDPDGIIPHDDWGGNKNMFFSPDLWREFIKPQVKAMVAATHELGMLYEQHSCGHIEPIIGDLVELGVDILQPIQGGSINNIARIKELYQNNIVLRGGMDMQTILANDTTEEKIRECVRNTLNAGWSNGGFIPNCVIADKMSPNGDQIRKIVDEEFQIFASSL